MDNFLQSVPTRIGNFLSNILTFGDREMDAKRGLEELYGKVKPQVQMQQAMAMDRENALAQEAPGIVDSIGKEIGVKPTQQKPLEIDYPVQGLNFDALYTDDNIQPGAQVMGAQAPTPTPTPMPTATPIPYPTPTIIPQFVDVAPEMQDIIRAIVQDPNQVNNFINLAAQESSLNPSNINQNSDQRGTKDYGLFQINDYWQRPLYESMGYTVDDLLNPEVNAEVAYEIWKRNEARREGTGFNPWVAAQALGLTSQ